MPMNPELKEKWIKALRSGDYKQGILSLCERRPDGDTFCCLGVLCEIAELQRYSVDHRYNISYIYAGDHDNTLLPLTFGNHVKIDRETQERLAKMNDDGKSFHEIADWIEKNL